MQLAYSDEVTQVPWLQGVPSVQTAWPNTYIICSHTFSRACYMILHLSLLPRPEPRMRSGARLHLMQSDGDSHTLVNRDALA